MQYSKDITRTSPECAGICPVAKYTRKIESRYFKILSYSFEEIYIFSSKTMKFLEVSQGALLNLGYTKDEMKNMRPADIKPRYSPRQFKSLLLPLISGEENIVTIQTIHQRKDGSTYDVDIRIQYAGDADPVFIAMVTDVTDRNKHEADLRALAFRDPGTDLYNRRYFLEHMEGTINHVNRMHSSVGLILIDMDDFSAVNNKYGHIAGDKIICDFAAKINDVFSRKTDVVARYGGDEFVVLCIDNSESNLLMKCKQLIKRLNKPLYYNGNEIVQTASIGICLRNSHDANFVTSEDLINGADVAMYKVKDSGKNNVMICENAEIIN